MVLPVLLVLVLGSLEVGYVMVTRYVVMNAAEAGARVGILPGRTVQDVTDVVRERLGDKLTYEAKIRGVGPDVPPGADTGVTLRYRPPRLTGLSRLVPHSMSYTAVMRHE